MRQIFYNKFNEIYDSGELRKSPLSMAELEELIPSQEDRLEYLRLFKELYSEALLFGGRHPLLNIIKTKDYPNELQLKYQKLLEFCLLKNLFDFDTFQDFKSYCQYEADLAFSLIDYRVYVFSFPEYESTFLIESIDDYRLRIERGFAQLKNCWYLSLRYGVSEGFCKDDNENSISLYRYNSEENSIKVCTYNEVKELFNKITKDLSECNQKIKSILKVLPEKKSPDFFDKQEQWFFQRVELDSERERLEDCLSIVENELQRFPNDIETSKPETTEPVVPEFKPNTVLHVYIGENVCHKEGHNIVQTTVNLMGRNSSIAKTKVEYCTKCNKFIISEQSYEKQKNMFGVMIGNFREVTNGDITGNFDLALESPLKRCGYNVGLKEELASSTRQYILGTIIRNGIMRKSEVISYLEYFIKMQGSKAGNEIALQKWKEDLAYLRGHNNISQPDSHNDKADKKAD